MNVKKKKDSLFHKTIGNEIKKINLSKVSGYVCLDMACDKNENKSQLSLFTGEKRQKNILCKVDSIIITQKDNIKKISQLTPPKLAALLAGGEVMAAGERVAGGDEKAAKI